MGRSSRLSLEGAGAGQAQAQGKKEATFAWRCSRPYGVSLYRKIISS